MGLDATPTFGTIEIWTNIRMTSKLVLAGRRVPRERISWDTIHRAMTDRCPGMRGTAGVTETPFAIQSQTAMEKKVRSGIAARIQKKLTKVFGSRSSTIVTIAWSIVWRKEEFQKETYLRIRVVQGLTTRHKIYRNMRCRPLLPLSFLMVCTCGSLGFPYAAKRIYTGQKSYVVNFSESEAKEILAHTGITNRYVYRIERDSSGAALFAHFTDIGTNENRGVLIVTENGLKILDLPHATGSTGFFDNLTKAYWYENGWCVFSKGSRLLWKKGSEPSRFGLIGAPGNEVLVLRYAGDPDSRVVRPDDPENPLFTLSEGRFNLRRVFCKGSTIFVFGLAPGVKGGGKWKRQSQTVIPDAVEVLDLDPDSPNVLCYKWGLVQKTAFLFNLETKAILKVNLEIWRDHGYFLREGVVRKIQTALEGKSVAK